MFSDVKKVTFEVNISEEFWKGVSQGKMNVVHFFGLAALIPATSC